eukprot:3893104-Rhodomonas_salina.2
MISVPLHCPARCYARSGTDIDYDTSAPLSSYAVAMRCPVLGPAMLLPLAMRCDIRAAIYADSAAILDHSAGSAAVYGCNAHNFGGSALIYDGDADNNGGGAAGNNGGPR